MPLTNWPRPCTVCLKPLRMYGKKTCGSPACIKEWRTGTPSINFMRMQYAEMTVSERFEHDREQAIEHDATELTPEAPETPPEISSSHKDAFLRRFLSPENAPIKPEGGDTE